MGGILERFLSAFDLAIAREMDAMRERMGPFEVELGNGQANGDTLGQVSAGDSGHAFTYVFDVFGSDESLVPGTECTLKLGNAESIVTIASLGSGSSGSPTVMLRSRRELRGLEGPGALVIYPWFLYERLRQVLSGMATGDDYFVESALRTFGKFPPKRTQVPLKTDLSGLNKSQQAAVALCGESDLAFVWGPPGTGKTYTLAKIAEELLAQGSRVLLTSTTNAAVDQALEKLAASELSQASIERGEFVRIGRSDAPTFGAALTEVVNRQGRESRDRLSRLRAAADILYRRVCAAEELLQQIDSTLDAAQGQLFGDLQTPGLSRSTVGVVFSSGRVASFTALGAHEQRRRVARRHDQLQRARAAAKNRGRRLADALAETESGAVSRARLVLSTMTNAYFSRFLEAERYDVVIIEEAGMATLPVLFYCAALARERVILVGDPSQLPPIIQSRDERVVRFMGRSIFEVTVPEPLASPYVALLDTQYRMHPAIGDLVSELYYQSAIQNDVSTHARAAIANSAPFPGQPIAVVDTGGETRCANPPRSLSRYNERSAAICVELAREAVSAEIESVAIITPYAEQSRVIRRALRDAGLQRASVECSTVHRFQGNERDLVILDAVDAEPLSPGILLAGRGSSSRNLLNVSLSRARGKLILVADLSYFESRAPESAIHEALGAAAASCGSIERFPG